MELIKKQKKEYEIKVVRFCCAKMKDAWRKYIELDKEKVVIFYHTGQCVFASPPFRFCPFCGDKIVMGYQ